jgi:hypothetical protein
VETRTGRLRARWLVLVLGGILFAAAVVLGPVTNADAQGQGKGQGKAQGQSQGQVQENSDTQGESVAERGGGQVKCLIEHTTGEGTPKILRIAAPAVRAHVANHEGDKLVAGQVAQDPVCVAAEKAGQDRDGDGDTNTCNPKGAVVTVTNTDKSGTLTIGDTVTVNFADTVVQPIDTDFSITLQGTGSPTQQVVLNAANTSTPEVKEGNLVLTVDQALTPALPITDVTVTAATGIGCEEDSTSQAQALSTETATLSGTATATESGGPALKTSSGKTIKLSAKTDKGEKHLEALAKKDAKVKVRGKKDGDTLEVTKVKSTKAKKK